MASPNLPVNVDSTYADATDPSVKAHQQHHDVLHAFVNKFDVTASLADGQAYVYDAASQTLKPGTVAGGGGGTPANGSVGTAQLADNAITAAKMADAAIGTAELADSSVTSAKIAPGAVATVDLADGAVTAVKMSGLLAHAQLPAGTTLAFPLSTAKTWSSRSQATARADLRVVVVGGQDESEWPAAVTILIDSWDVWDLIPSG